MAKFWAGQWAPLWEELVKCFPIDRVKTRTSASEASDAARKVRRAKTLIGEGAPSKALQSLLSLGTHDASDPAIKAKLESLHPHVPPPDLQSLPASVPDPLGPMDDEEWAKLTTEAVRSFPRASAPGPSGLRPCHLADSLRRPGRSGALIKSLVALCRLWVEGKVPQTHAASWCAATLAALRKKDGGVRPIAVGDTFRRLVGKALLGSARAKAEVAKLRPVQLGVG